MRNDELSHKVNVTKTQRLRKDTSSIALFPFFFVREKDFVIASKVDEVWVSRNKSLKTVCVCMFRCLPVTAVLDTRYHYTRTTPTWYGWFSCFECENQKERAQIHSMVPSNIRTLVAFGFILGAEFRQEVLF